jgi:hypothetical protein
VEISSEYFEPDDIEAVFFNNNFIKGRFNTSSGVARTEIYGLAQICLTSLWIVGYQLYFGATSDWEP